jgi:serine/threonine protein kinase
VFRGWVGGRVIQSVAHVHARGVVHGDLKPSNWLWNSNAGLPCLCDLETAKDRGISGATTVRGTNTTGPNLHTDGYTAPELVENPAQQKTKESDMFALGRSIQYVLAPVVASTSPELAAMRSLVADMTRNSPSERVTASTAAEAWWQSALNISDGETTVVRCDEIRFSQECCSRTFTDGQSFQQLIVAIHHNPEYPLNNERLVLDVVKKDGTMFSLDNRRLHCFHAAERQCPQRPVWIRIRIHQHSHVWTRFRSNFSTRNHGVSIRVR